MATATVHIENVGGFAGVARCFRLDPPVSLAGIDREFVTAWAQSGYGQITRPEVCLVPATESGAAAPLIEGAPASLMRHPGSYTLHDNPDTPERVDGAFALALLMLGGYIIEPADAVE